MGLSDCEKCWETHCEHQCPPHFHRAAPDPRYEDALRKIRPKIAALLDLSKAMGVRYDITQLSEVLKIVDEAL